MGRIAAYLTAVLLACAIGGDRAKNVNDWVSHSKQPSLQSIDDQVSTKISSSSVDKLLNATQSPLMKEGWFDSNVLQTQLVTLISSYKENEEYTFDIFNGMYITGEGHILSAEHGAEGLFEGKGRLIALSYGADGSKRVHRITKMTSVQDTDLAIYHSPLRDDSFKVIPISSKNYKDGEAVYFLGADHRIKDSEMPFSGIYYNHEAGRLLATGYKQVVRPRFISIKAGDPERVGLYSLGKDGPQLKIDQKVFIPGLWPGCSGGIFVDKGGFIRGVYNAGVALRGSMTEASVARYAVRQLAE